MNWSVLCYPPGLTGQAGDPNSIQLVKYLLVVLIGLLVYAYARFPIRKRFLGIPVYKHSTSCRQQPAPNVQYV
jgi:hypothetical protein